MGFKKRVNREDSIVVSDGDMNEINECFNSLKDNLLYMGDEKENKVLQIESSMSGEGKTTLACNLAVSLSFNKKKVLVIDLDFRKPRVHRIFKQQVGDGLVDYISEKISVEQMIKHTSYDGVDVITRGSVIYNPSFLLTSVRFKELISKLRDTYDFIILDSPPILQITDYIHISKVSDAIVLVAAYGRTKRAQLRETSKLLNKDGINVIGTVMTFVDKKDPFSSYYGTYHASYGEDNTVKRRKA